MSNLGFRFLMSDGQTIDILPKENSKSCQVFFGDYMILLNVESGEFTLYSSKFYSQDNSILGINRLERVKLEVDKNQMFNGESDVSPLYCKVKNACCNCGSGWVCNGVI